MKRLVLIAVVIMSIMTCERLEAQVRVNINIGSQPVWGPAGYDYVEYYYLPDIDAYYYVPRRQFIYLSGDRWIFSASLPPRYRGYNLYSGYKVVLNEPRPYLHGDIYRERYAPYRGRHDQVIIRERHDRGEHHDNGRHNGWRDHGHGGHGQHHDRD
jgi:hypothetical protein